jgi:kynurenine formamidase
MCSPAVLSMVQARLRDGSPISRRRVLGVGGALAGAAGLPRFAMAQGATPVASPVATGGMAVLDLTHVITPELPVWPGNEPFVAEVVKDYATDGFYAQSLSFWEHTGTHLDAPAHFVEGMPTAELLPPEMLVAPLAVVDIAARAAGDPDAAVTVEDLEAWEAANGTLPEGAFVAMHSGWAAKIDDAEAFINMDSDGVMHFPGFSPEAATFLIEERNIVGIRVDTLSQDPGNSTDFGTHVAILGAGRYGIEGLANLDQAPASGATVIIGAPKHVNASGGPSRVLALL